MGNSNIQCIKAIVNKHDPIGLIAGGAPEDEYDEEILHIANYIKEDKVLFAKKIFNLFINQFSDEIAGDFAKYELMAEELQKCKIY